MQSIEQERLVGSYVDITAERAVGRASNEFSWQHAQVEDASLLPPHCNECVSTVGNGWFAARIDKGNAGTGVVAFLVAYVNAVSVKIADDAASTKIDCLIRNEDGQRSIQLKLTWADADVASL